MADIETYENAGQQAAAELRSSAARLKRQATEAQTKIQDQAETAWDDVLDSVRQHPVQAVGITLAAGATLGALAVVWARSGEPTASERIRGWTDTGVDVWSELRKNFKRALMSLKDSVDGAVDKYK